MSRWFEPREPFRVSKLLISKRLQLCGFWEFFFGLGNTWHIFELLLASIAAVEVSMKLIPQHKLTFTSNQQTVPPSRVTYIEVE